MGFTFSYTSLRRSESASSARFFCRRSHHSLLPVDQPYVSECPIGSGGREAGFLIRPGFIGVPISGVDDSIGVRWRSFNNSWCVCSNYTPHAGLPQELRVNFWRDFVVTARHVQDTAGLPLIIAGDANIFCHVPALVTPPSLHSWICCTHTHTKTHKRHTHKHTHTQHQHRNTPTPNTHAPTPPHTPTHTHTQNTQNNNNNNDNDDDDNDNETDNSNISGINIWRS